MNPEAFSQNSPEVEKEVSQDIISFKDTESGVGSSGLLFKAPEGTPLEWSGHKWVDRPSMRSSNTMLVATESGNQYILGKGLIINSGTGETYIAPHGREGVLPQITFGESWEVPGMFKTSKVQAVLAEYKVGNVMASVHSDQESPFTDANRALFQRAAEASEKGLL